MNTVQMGNKRSEFFLFIFIYFAGSDSDSDGSASDGSSSDDQEEEEDEEEEQAPAVLHGRDRARLCPRHKRKVRDFASALNSENYDTIPILRQDIRYLKLSDISGKIFEGKTFVVGSFLFLSWASYLPYNRIVYRCSVADLE